MDVGQGRAILLVEDDQPVSALFGTYLREMGFVVHQERYGTPALRYAAEHRPDLVILDLRLPDVSGYDVCKELRTLYGPWDVPIVMLTSLDAPSDQVRGFAFGADAYLTKPLEPPAILPTLMLLLGKGDLPTCEDPAV